MLVLSATCAYIAPAHPSDTFGALHSSIVLPDNSSIIGPGTLLNPVEIRGDNVLVDTVTVSSAISVTGKNATIQHVRSTTESPGAVKIVEADVGNCTIRNTTGARAVVGIGHGAGIIKLSECHFENKYAFVLQEARGTALALRSSLDDSCSSLPNVNLTALLNVFGREYEVRFFNDGQYAHQAKPHTFETIVYVAAANILFASNLYILLGKELF